MDTPTDINDPVLGQLKWESERNYWSGQMEYRPGHRIDILVKRRENLPPEKDIEEARQNFLRVQERESECRRWSSDNLLDQRWNTDEPMTAQADGTFRIYWNDQGALFWGGTAFVQISTPRANVSMSANREIAHPLGVRINKCRSWEICFSRSEKILPNTLNIQRLCILPPSGFDFCCPEGTTR